MTKKKLEEEYIEVKSNVIVSWFDNNHWGDRGDPITTKISKVELNDQGYRNVFVTLPGQRGGWWSTLRRLIKVGNKYYVRKEEHSSPYIEECLKKILYKGLD